MSQAITIKGRVINEQGEPILNATVTIKQSSRSTFTDAKGTFTIPDSLLTDTLIISAIGYETKQEPCNGRNLITIILKGKIMELSEVIVNNGYQSLVKETSTGSFDKIDNKTFNRVVSTDILSRLEGLASSIFFTKNFASKEIFIRGISTLRPGGSAPLIVLDNFPYDGDIRNINPDDVESITILKDAAASSIWGAKAGNGVIVITTKKANYNQPPSLSFNYNLSLQEKTNLLEDRNFIVSPDFIEVERFLFSKGFYDASLNNTSSRPVISPVVEILAKQRAGQLAAADADAMISALAKNDIRKDMMKYLRRTFLRSQYTLNLSGGSAMINYQFNAGYDKTLTEIANNANERATLSSLLNFRFVRNLEIQAGINYTYRNDANNGIENINPGGGKSVLYPYAQLADQSGNSLAVLKDYRMAYVDTAGAGQLLDWKYRPLDELKFSDSRTISKALLLKLNIKYNFLRHFTFSINSQWQDDNQQLRSNRSTGMYSTRNLINRYSQLAGTAIKRNIPLGGILDNTFNGTVGYACRTQLNFNQTRKKIYRLNAIVGFELRQSHLKSNSYRLYGYNDDLLTFSNVDYVNSYQLYGNFGTAAIPNFQDLQDQLNRFVSLYSNSSFTFHDRYIFSASVRKDASNLFGVNTNHKWTPLWSAGTGWKISEEKFYHIKWLPSLKLRLSYGFNGNIDNTVSSLPVISYRSGIAPTNLPYATISSSWNPDLRWEKIRMINTGIDFAFKNERINGSIEFYLKNASDLLAPAPIDPTLGVPGNVITMNVANLSGHGVDLKLNSNIIDAGIKLNATVLFSYVTNKVTNYLRESPTKGSFAGYGYGITPIVGKDPYALISYRFVGLDPQTGDPIGIVNDTLSKNYFPITNTALWNDMVIGGTTRPPFYGNLLPAISWKGFSLSVNISYKFGYYFRRGTIGYSSFFSSWLGQQDYYKRWQKPGDEKNTTVPSMIYPANSSRDQFYQYSEATVEKGDNIRLQDISVNWEISNAKFGKLSIKKMQLYSYINNLGFIWKATGSGLDPDYGNSLPPQPAFSFGCKMNF